MVKALIGPESFCEACGHRLAVDVHEVATRGRTGGSAGTAWLSVDAVVILCRVCHTFITDNPGWALENGWVIPLCAKEKEEQFLVEAKALRLDSPPPPC